MDNMIGTSNPFLKLQQYRVRQNQIEKTISRLPSAPKGTVNFGYHKLKREGRDLQEKIRKIHSVLLPDTIA